MTWKSSCFYRLKWSSYKPITSLPYHKGNYGHNMLWRSRAVGQALHCVSQHRNDSPATFNLWFEGISFYFCSSKRHMKVTVALKTPTVICVSGNLVSSASDITDQCDVRLEEEGGHTVYQSNYVTIMAGDVGEIRRVERTTEKIW